MPRFSERSLQRLATCHQDLQLVCLAVVKTIDITILEGHRGKEAQNAAYEAGTSHLRWPDGEHNEMPSRAVDVAPYPVRWEGDEALKRFHVLGGFMLATGLRMGIPLRWGGDWDGDFEYDDQRLHDLPHFELLDPQPPSSPLGPAHAT